MARGRRLAVAYAAKRKWQRRKEEQICMSQKA
jgi:hypothetical protein